MHTRTSATQSHDYGEGKPDVIQIRRRTAASDGVAPQIRGARAVLGWTQPQLAERVGLAVRSIVNLEAGACIPRKATWKKFLTTFATEGITIRHCGCGWKLVVSHARSEHPAYGAEQVSVADACSGDCLDGRCAES